MVKANKKLGKFVGNVFIVKAKGIRRIDTGLIHNGN